MIKPGCIVTFEGARYKAAKQSYGCERCAFENRPYGCDDMPMCVDKETSDGVIFIIEPIK